MIPLGLFNVLSWNLYEFGDIYVIQGRYPLTIYNHFIQFMLSWIIPFAFASFYPTTHFLGRHSFAFHFYLVPFVAAGFSLMAILVWRRGVQNYTSTGS